MTAETLVLPTSDGPTTAALAEPDGPVRGGVIVLHATFGLTEQIHRLCVRFADAGWRAIAPDLFHRLDPSSPAEVAGVAGVAGVAATSGTDPDAELAAEALRAAESITGSDLLDDIDAAEAVLAEEGTALDRCAVVGFSVGGTAAFHAAVDRPFAAAATFCGGGIRARRFGEPSQLELASQLQAPWLGLYGALDPTIDTTDVEALRAAAAQAPVPINIISYPNAGYAFHDESRPGLYRPQQALDAWSRTLIWFDAHVPA